MSKIIIMQGLPGSGKSTKAAELIKSQGDIVRLNKDLLRKMLHFGKWSGLNEAKTQNASKALARFFLLAGTNVIVDDTNLNPNTVQGWVDLAKKCEAKIEYCWMNTSMEECVQRDSLRTLDAVGETVIIEMALENSLYSMPKKGFVLCDIDGTLADISHRRHFVQGEKKDWKGFFEYMMEDTPRIEVVDKVIALEGEGYEIIFVSARPDTYRAFTEDWILNKAFNTYKPHKHLIMRKGNDMRPDTEVKQEIFNRFFKDKYPIHKVIDDRPSVIRMWRSNGLEVDDVGNGIEF